MEPHFGASKHDYEEKNGSPLKKRADFQNCSLCGYIQFGQNRAFDRVSVLNPTASTITSLGLAHQYWTILNIDSLDLLLLITF